MNDEQMSLASLAFDRYARTTKRAAFLTEMDAIVPCSRLCVLIAPHYPMGEGGRPPIPLERMLPPLLLAAMIHSERSGDRRAQTDIRI